MRVAVGVDHRGFAVKDELLALLVDAGYEVLDLGTDSDASVDYPDFAAAVGQAIVDGEADRGIVVCGSGVGACVAANKIAGVRAATCHDTYSAHQGVEHDDLNLLCLGSSIVGMSLIAEIVASFLGAEFAEAEERYVRRLRKVQALERGERLSP
ncbi:MAG: ribose 5-phosphate isomerase B [Chloroflexi bacterium]|nr:ribose 5-phosphate isomerase B [Chloroflexota bacterium]